MSAVTATDLEDADMGSMDRSARSSGVATTLAIALVAAVALALPATAQDQSSAWPQAGASAAGTYQSGADGPADPGLKWIQNLDELTSETAPDGFNVSDRHPPVFGADGTIMLTAGAVGQSVGEGNRHLIGVDPDDGSLAWNLPFAQDRCAPAVDSQGRGWGLFVDGEGQDEEFDGVTDPLIEAFDTATGQRDPASALDPVTEVAPDVLNWCRETSLHIGGAGEAERAILFDGRGQLGVGSPGIVAIDLSGDQAAPAWVIEPDAATAPFDRVLRTSTQERIGAMSADSLYVPTVTEGALELVELSLTSGDVTNRVALPLYDEDAGSVADIDDVEQATVLLDGDTAVISVATRTDTSAIGALHGVDLTGDWLAPAWSQPFDDQPSTQRGPVSLALSGSNVISSSGVAVDTLYVHDTATGQPAAWSTTSATLQGPREPGQYVTDASDTIYVAVRGPSGSRTDRSVVAYAADGTPQWRVNRASLMEASGLDDGVDGLKSVFDVRAIDAEGTLYLLRDDQLVAIDNSGGLAVVEDEDPDDVDDTEPTFPDVSPDNVHADNIERLVELEITTGDTEGNYNPSSPVTRAQFATFLVRALGEDAFPTDTIVPSDTFVDVDPDNVHAPNIAAVAAAGITTGVTEDTFAPNQPLPRDQMATLLVRAFGDEVFPTDTIIPGDAFVDVDPDSVHADSIARIAVAGVTTGRTEDTFDPAGIVFRDQMASFLIRTIDLGEAFIQPDEAGEDLF